MKLRAKKQNSQMDTMEPNNSELVNLKKNKKISNKSLHREFSHLESNLTSKENSKIDHESESRYKPKLRNIEMNYPGKYKKMNSGKYLYKTKKPEKRTIMTKKKISKNFDYTTVKIMMNFFNRLCDIEYEKINSLKKKKTKKSDQISMKFLSDDTLNSNITSKNNFIQYNNKYNNNKNSIYNYNKSINLEIKSELASGLPLSSNIFYKFIYPNNNNSNDFNKPNKPLNITKKVYDQNMISNTFEKSHAEVNSNLIYPYNHDKKLYSYNEYVNQPIKEIIRKSTYNHIIAANFIKISQEEFLKNPNNTNSNINNNIYNNSTNYNKPNELNVIKQSTLYKDNLTSKYSTESEKSEEKLNNNSLNNLDPSQNKVKSNGLVKTSFQCNVEDLTKNQLDQIKEIFKGKIEKETVVTSRKNSEKQ